MPKPNFYQSLHTTVIGETGQPFEVQIRTREMDLIAERGIAAHWKYKEGRLGPHADDARFQWLRQLVDWQSEVSDPRQFLSSLKVDLYPDEVYTFTPKGEVFAFPRGATPIDFAYRVHTDVGHRCVGARVNGKLVPAAHAAPERGHRRDPDRRPARRPRATGCPRSSRAAPGTRSATSSTKRRSSRRSSSGGGSSSGSSRSSSGR